jgi:hypothetical protein
LNVTLMYREKNKEQWLVQLTQRLRNILQSGLRLG